MFYDAFDTVTQVIAYCDSEEEFAAQMDALHADLLEYHKLYDIYNDYDGITNIKTINDNAGLAPVTVDDKILGMLELAQTMYDTTDGKLNIAMGSVLNIWHNYREAALADTDDSNNQLPTQDELDAAAQHCDIHDLVIDDAARTVYLIDPATLWPAAYFDGVSVLAPDSGVADCLTTGLFCMPLEEGQAIVESLDGVEALWCTTDGQIVKSSGWDEKANG